MSSKADPQERNLSDVFQRHPQAVKPLLEYHDILLRGESPLSVAERELIAAYVSGLNACEFCLGAHSIIAAAFGVDENLINALLTDLDSAPIAPNLSTLLRYVEKLTRQPSRVSETDRAEVFAAGWNEQALHDAVSVCALFNFMNRLVEGMGVKTSPAIQAQQKQRHQSQVHPSTTPYMDYGRMIGVVD